MLQIDNTVEVPHIHVLQTWKKMQVTHLYLKQFVEPKEILGMLCYRLKQIEGDDGLDFLHNV